MAETYEPEQAIQDIAEERLSLSPQKPQIQNPPEAIGQIDKKKTLKERWNQLSKMTTGVIISTFFSTIILLIIGSCYIYTVTKGPKFLSAPVRTEAVYEANNQRIVYYYFKMNEPSMIRVGKLVEGYAQAVYYLYTDMEYQARTVGRITLMDRLSGIFLKAFNQKNIEMQYDLEKILQYYESVLTPQNKRLLQGSKNGQKEMNQNPQISYFAEVLNKAITNLFASMLNVQVSTLQNIKETTLIGTANTNTKQTLYDIKTEQAKTEKTQLTYLDVINNKTMTETEQTQLANDIIRKVVQPVLKDLLRQIIEYGPNIAEKAGVIFDDSVDLRVTYQKVTLSNEKMQNFDPKLTAFRNQPAKIITRENMQIYANKHANPTDTKTMTQRTYNAVSSCTNLDENTKMCTKQEWQSEDTPFPMAKESKENEKNFKNCSRNKLAIKNTRLMNRQLTDAAISGQINSKCGSIGSSSTLNSNQF